MKKLLIFMLVLGMASSANAALASFVLDVGGTDVLPDTIVLINIISDVEVTGFAVGAVAVTNASVPAVGELNLKLQERTPWSHGEYKDGTIENIYIFQISGGVELGTPVPAVGEVLYSFNVTAPSEIGTIITIDDWFGDNPFGMPPFPVATALVHDGGAIEDLGGLTLTVIPEPMTVLLLGLGGLFLRRRR